MLDTLNKSKYHIVLDLCQGYHQVPVVDEDKENTAFSYFGGHYEYNFMPLGLLYAGLLWKTCLVYSDYAVVFSENFDEHLKRLEEVFNRFQESD